MPQPFDEITERVLKVFDVLLKNDLVKSDAQFCKQIAFNRQEFSMIKSGGRGFPAKHLDQLCRAFDVNPLYIQFGTGQMFTTPIVINNTYNVSSFTIDTDNKQHVRITFTENTGITKTLELITT